MERWEVRLRQVPLVIVLCGLLLALWGWQMPDPVGVRCDRIAPRQVTCLATLPCPWAWLPQASHPFQLQDVAITSDLCDKTPRGGVRFCHHLILLGAGQQMALPEIRTPLSGSALSDQLQRFMAGEGSPQLAWSRPAAPLPLRPLAIVLLLAAATWGLWDLRWPSERPSERPSILTLDGASVGPDSPNRPAPDQPD